MSLDEKMRKLVKEQGRRLDWLWAALSASLAIEAIIGRGTPDAEALLYFCVHLLTAILFLIRNPPLERSTGWLSYVVAGLCTIYAYAYDVDIASETTMFPFGRSLMIGGAVLCLFSMLSMGRCFGVLPIYRGVRTSGLYRIVRHPIYASYILMDMGLIAAYPSVGNAMLFSLGLILFVTRIHYEETLLRHVDQYRSYIGAVRFRLLPFVY
jgi:protein-S-isoprenylcysteine O-methyltransferase Ste14